MQAQITVDLQAAEKNLIEAIKVLSPIRILQLLDFAQWLQTQSTWEPDYLEEVTQQEMEDEEKLWEQSYMANREDFQAMAQQALLEFEAGETTEMIIEDGVIKPL